MQKIGIIFDMDGTLWDSAKGVAGSWTDIIQKNYDPDMEITEADVKGVMGMTMDKIAEKLFPKLSEDERTALLDKCCDAENDYLREHGGLVYDGFDETMKSLKALSSNEHDIHLYIVSNCQKGYIEAFLDHYDYWKYFDDIECYGNNNLVKGDNIRLVMERNSLDKAYYVGDIQGDYDSSVEAGAGFIHAKYGFGTINAKVPVIGALVELPGVIETILSNN